MNRKTKTVYFLTLAAAIGLIVNASYMQAKAWLAQVLISQSWHQAMVKGERIRPWPWSDTWPVSRIIMPQHKVDLVVLAGDDGRTLAFGPGARLSGVMPGERGVSMISAHRDTYFQFLENVKIGERFEIQTPRGSIVQYRIKATKVLNQPFMTKPFDSGKSQIVLVTCYPFHALNSGGPQRYVVYAEQDSMSKPI